MADDVTILAAGSADVPEGYTVPSGQEIRPRAVIATIDGTSASGDFVPILQIVGPSGLVVAESASDTIVAAGGSARTSWFPHVGGSGSAASSAVKWAYLPGTTKTFAGNGGSGSTSTNFSGSSSFWYTNASTVFELGSTTISGSTYYGISVKGDGHYLFWPYFELSGSVAGNPIDFQIAYQNSALSLTSWDVEPFAQVIAALTHTNEVGASRTAVLAATTGSTYPLGPVIYAVTNFTNYAPQAAVHVIAVQLDADGTAI